MTPTPMTERPHSRPSTHIPHSHMSPHPRLTPHPSPAPMPHIANKDQVHRPPRVPTPSHKPSASDDASSLGSTSSGSGAPAANDRTPLLPASAASRRTPPSRSSRVAALRPSPNLEMPPATPQQFTYTSFPLAHPRTPWEDRDLPKSLGDYLPSSLESKLGLPLSWRSREVRKAQNWGRDVQDPGSAHEEGFRASGAWQHQGDLEAQRAEPSELPRESIPKLTRGCFWSELKCYGSYIAPVVLIFGVLVLLVALTLYARGRSGMSGPGPLHKP